MCGNDQHAVLVDAVIATELLRNGDTELHVQSELPVKCVTSLTLLCGN